MVKYLFFFEFLTVLDQNISNLYPDMRLRYLGPKSQKTARFIYTVLEKSRKLHLIIGHGVSRSFSTYLGTPFGIKIMLNYRPQLLGVSPASFEIKHFLPT